MSDSRANLKIPRDLFEDIKADKPDRESWPRYLERKCLGDIDE